MGILDFIIFTVGYALSALSDVTIFPCSKENTIIGLGIKQ